MKDNYLEDLLEEQSKALLRKSKIEDKKTIMSLLNIFLPWTGRADVFFANEFMYESVALIKNSVFLFENGYFDAALYSLRQSNENMNNMLFLSEHKEKIASWVNKEKYPTNSMIISELSKNVDNFREIKEKTPSWNYKYKELLNKANKYIHKQGFDTFEREYKQDNKAFATVNSLFNEFLKCSIAQLYLIYIAINPISLILSDQELSHKVHYDLLDEKLPIEFLCSTIGETEFESIKDTRMFKSLKTYFEQFEELNYATEMLIKYQYLDYKMLDDIKKQEHLLGYYERIVYYLACNNVSFSYLFFSEILISPFLTSLEPNKIISTFSVDMFDGCSEESNKQWNDMFLNVFYNDTDKNSFIAIVSNEKLNDKQTFKIHQILQKLEKQ